MASKGGFVLIEMNVANFRSLKGTQTFSLAKGKGNELESTNVFTVKAASDYELLRSAVIYGPNASGKSNFLLALKTMKHIVIESATTWQRGDLLPGKPSLWASLWISE